MKNLIVFLIVILISFSYSFANKNEVVDGIISGYIQDANTKKGIEYANIAIYSLPDSTLITGTIKLPSGRAAAIPRLMCFFLMILSP